MPAQQNKFKLALEQNKKLIGLWLGLANSYTSELCAQIGFDWLLIDGEHAPNDVISIMGQLQSMQAYDSHIVVRAPSDDRVLLKQYLDVGVQSLLIPMVETAEQAKQIVRSVQYPPTGVRGVGAALARASNFNLTPDYLTTANDEICLLLQVESMSGIEALDEILNVEGVDGIFIGPADLAADMGFVGKPNEPKVQEVIIEALNKINQSNKASGILTSDPSLLKNYKQIGINFLAVGSDVGVLINGLKSLKKQYE